MFSSVAYCCSGGIAKIPAEVNFDVESDGINDCREAATWIFTQGLSNADLKIVAVNMLLSKNTSHPLDPLRHG